jgi:GT2 family glycosyltransferase
MPIILAAGMARSGSTWLFNVIRILLGRTGHPLYACWVDERDENAERQAYNVLIKIHDPSEELASKASAIFTSHRDLRDVAISALHAGFAADSSEMIGIAASARAAHDFWAPRSRVDIRYSDIVASPTLCVIRIALALAQPIDDRSAAQVAEAVDQLAPIVEPNSSHDRTNLLHAKHRIDGRPGRWIGDLDPETARAIELANVGWLSRYGFLNMEGVTNTVKDLDTRVRRLEFYVNDLRLKRRSDNRFRPSLFTLDQYPPRRLVVPPTYVATEPPPRPPSFAIVTPTYNFGRFIERTIQSILTQNYPALNYKIQDGGSTDDTLSILHNYQDQISWASEPDNGQADAINRGFASLDGDLMGWLNSDDVLLPGTLNYVAKYFSENENVDAVYGHRIYVDTSDNEIGRSILPRHDRHAIKWMDFIPQETLFWRRRVWDKLGGLDVGYQFALDWDFILRAHKAGFKFRRLPRFLACFRVHEEQKTIKQVDIGARESDRLRIQYLGRAVTHKDIRTATRSYLRRHIMTVRAYKLGLFRY